MIKSTKILIKYNFYCPQNVTLSFDQDIKKVTYYNNLCMLDLPLKLLNENELNVHSKTINSKFISSNSILYSHN